MMHRLSRRWVIGCSGATALAGASALCAADALRPTPAQTSGPFYPLDKPLDRDADLTLIQGHRRRATGQVLHVMGRVLDARGQPVSGARLEIWQANAHGRYAHPNDFNEAPLDPHFEGFAELVTDDQGRYRFKTIKPGAYPAGRTVRPPHIHFSVAARDRKLVTQMYFPGKTGDEREYADDFVFAAAGPNRRALVASVSAPTPDLEPDSLLARWDIVLGA